MAIVCPSQPLQLGSNSQICVNGNLDCVGTNTLYRWYKNNVLVTTTATPCLTFQPLTCADAGSYTCELVGSNGTFTTAACKVKVKPCPHTGDPNNDSELSLSELLRLIQYFNSLSYGCDPESEDGFAPGGADTDCLPHASDYNPQDWRLTLNELLRAIQFYNSGGYRACDEGEDGFCPGLD